MKILLVNSNRHKHMVPVIPFGLCWVASALEQAGHDVSVLDLMFSLNTADDLVERIDAFQPQLIGVSIRNIDDANDHFFLEVIKKEIIDPIKECTAVPLVIGGSAVGISGKEMLQYFDLPYAIRGDGELAMIELAAIVEKGEKPTQIKGLLVRVGDDFEENPLNQSYSYMDLPHANIPRFIDIRQYAEHHSSVQIQSKRGCALNCTYCVYKRIEGDKYRLREPHDIADEIDTLHKEWGINTFEFTDSTFNIPLDHAKATLQAILQKKLPIELKTSDFNPGAIDEEFVHLLKESGFHNLGITVESGSDVILENMGKSYRLDHIRRAVELIRGIIPSPVLSWSFLLGAPKESEETLAETYHFIKEITLPHETVVIATGIRVYKGTELAEEMESDDHFFQPVLLEPKAISLEKIEEIARGWTKEQGNILLMQDLLDKEKMELFHFRMNLQNLFA